MIAYQGRWWDAPATDDAKFMSIEGDCILCEEEIAFADDAIFSEASQAFHTECWLRSVLGDLAHLEKRCLCFDGSDHDDEGTYREQSKRALDWLIKNGRGRWRDVANPATKED